MSGELRPPRATKMTLDEANESRLNVVARALAAHMMGLVNDQLGVMLPDEIWTQMLPRARSILDLIIARRDLAEAQERLLIEAEKASFGEDERKALRKAKP